MVLTWRRGIFHRTLKAEQLIVSSWMSNGGLRRSVSCKKKKERQRKKTDRRRQWVWWLLEIFSPRLTPGRTFHKNAGFIRDESQTICSCLRAEKSSSILMKAEGLRSDWTRPEITRLPSRQPCCSYQMEGGGEMRWTNENVFWLCRYGDGIFSGGLSDTSGDCVWASSDLRARENPPGYIQVLEWDHQHPWWCPTETGCSGEAWACFSSFPGSLLWFPPTHSPPPVPPAPLSAASPPSISSPFSPQTGANDSICQLNSLLHLLEGADQ